MQAVQYCAVPGSIIQSNTILHKKRAQLRGVRLFPATALEGMPVKSLQPSFFSTLNTGTTITISNSEVVTSCRQLRNYIINRWSVDMNAFDWVTVSLRSVQQGKTQHHQTAAHHVVVFIVPSFFLSCCLKDEKTHATIPAFTSTTLTLNNVTLTCDAQG